MGWLVAIVPLPLVFAVIGVILVMKIARVLVALVWFVSLILASLLTPLLWPRLMRT